MAIVRNKKTNDIYRYVGDNVFKNIRTEVEGKVSDEAAKKTFVINLDATELINEHPIIEDLIRTLNLKIEVNDKSDRDDLCRT